jgi:DNA-binding response OmpR family regulator
MSRRILIIDDEEHIRRMTRLTLETAGYEAGEAADGFEGLEAFGDGAAWDAVLLDQKMPGLDGLETLRRIKERTPGARVIMVTAFASIELAVDAMKLGASDFVRKPMTPEVIRNAVAAALSKPSGTATSASPVATSSGLTLPGSVLNAQPLVQTITMNGFTILDDEGAPRREPDERRFTVISPEGEAHDVLVRVDAEVVRYVERMTGRRLAPENSFWTSQAKRLLSDFLWNEGRVPPTRSLTVKDVGRDELLVAARWEDGV